MHARFTRNLLMLCFGMALAHTSSAQNAARIYVEPDGWSIGTTLGESDMWGNVGTKSVLEHYINSKYFNRMGFMGGMFGRYTVHPCFAIRLGVNYGQLYATDKWNYDLAKNSANQGTDAYQRYARNQDALDDVFEGEILFELTPKRFNPESRGASRKGQPYIAAGFTYFHFEPFSTAANTTTWVKTYDLDLEGEGFKGPGYPPKYSLWQPAIPLAIGYRWDIGEHLNLGVEYMYRYCFTSYLDGVSGKYVSDAAFQENLSPSNAALAEVTADKGHYTGLEAPNAAGNLRGVPGVKDSYSTLSIVLYYKINTNTRTWWK